MGDVSVRHCYALCTTKSPRLIPDDFGALIRAEIAKWGKLVREAGIKAE